MTQVWVMTHGYYEIDKIEVFATSEAAEKEHQRLMDEQTKKAHEHAAKWPDHRVPNWMTRDNWNIEPTELRE